MFNYELVNSQSFHILQSPQWGGLREREGHKVIRIDDVEGAYCQIVFHKLPKWFPSRKKYIGEVWRGPVVESGFTPQKMNLLLEKIFEIGKEIGAVFIKFEPKIIKGSELENSFKKYCIRGEQTFIPCTAILDLTRDENEILMGIDKYTQKSIRKAQRKGVIVKVYINPAEQKQAINRAYVLLKETSLRGGFRIRSESFYNNLIDIQDDKLKIYIIEATVNGKVASSYITMTMGDTIYNPYNGSTRFFSEYKANNLINWELIKLAKSKELKKYDQWGVLPENAPKTDSMWGVTNFKMAFGGKREEYIGAYDMVISSKDYRLFSFAWGVRQMMKKIKKGFS